MPPTDADIDNEMVGKICRCGTYARVKSAIKLAANSGIKQDDSMMKVEA